MSASKRPTTDTVALLESKGIATDDEDDEDIHFCKKCQKVFKSIESYLEHKVKHDNFKVTYSRSNKDKGIVLPKLTQRVPRKQKNKSENENPEGEKSNGDQKENKEKRKYKKRSEVDVTHIIERSTYICNKCDKKFNREATLRWHIKYDHEDSIDAEDEEEEEEQCEVDDETEYVPEKEEEKPTLPETEEFATTDVDSQVQAPDSKRQKLSGEEMSLRPFCCDTCGNKFRDFQVLKVHQLTHTNRRDYPCTFEGCEYAFKTRGSLKRHLRRHTGERPFECAKCKRTFTEAGALTRHNKSRNPCTEKTDSDFPRYGKQWKPDHNISANVGAVQQLVRLDEGTSTGDLQPVDDAVNHIDGDSQVVAGNETIHAEIITQNADGSIGTINIVTLDNLAAEELEGLEPTQCRVCKEDMVTFSNLKDHLRIHLADMTFKCSTCHFTTDKMEELDSHMITVHQTPVKDDENGQSKMRTCFESSTPDEEKRNAQIAVRQLLEIPGALDPDDTSNFGAARNAYKCPACDRTFRGSSYLKQHMKSHAGVKPNKCSICEKSFTTKDALTKHLTVHSDDRQFKCGECGRLFKRISHIREHLKTHSTERPYVCQICKKAFKTMNAVKVHQRTHNNFLPYQCKFCDRFFREKSSLHRHTRMHTGERPYRCNHCNRGFSEHGTLTRHLKSKVPCTKQLYLTRKDGMLETIVDNEEMPSVLTEFSSVVADTQYILQDGGDSVDLSGTEYVVVHTDVENSDQIQNLEIVTDGEIDPAILDQLTNEGSYVVVSEHGNNLRIIDSATGQTLATLPEATSNETVALPLSENEIEAIAMAPVSDSDAVHEAMIVANVVDEPASDINTAEVQATEVMETEIE
ncbi:hypothetical protein SNE40_020284 [Patella caerulea]|uniref:C2H2-type domain-containing protein n=1 Tax=Patella caerulea TaxID=87958 RepID=A0AAN8IYE7_PATCE